MRHFTDQTTDATISKFGLGVLNSIRMKKGIFKRVLIEGLIKKIVYLSALYLKDLFRFNPFQTILILPIRAVLINAIINTGKTLAPTVEGLSYLFRIARKSSCKFYTTTELAQALGQSTEL